MSCGRDEVLARIAPATIACERVRQTFFDRAIMAIPMHVTIASRDQRAPGRLGSSSGLQAEDSKGKGTNQKPIACDEGHRTCDWYRATAIASPL